MRKFILSIFLISFVFLTGCGTLFWPERRGNSRHLDAGVAILDGIGLLFFILPGVIAYAVDLSTGCIFLSGGGHSHRASLVQLNNNLPLQLQIDMAVSNYYGPNSNNVIGIYSPETSLLLYPNISLLNE